MSHGFVHILTYYSKFKGLFIGLFKCTIFTLLIHKDIENLVKLTE